MNLDHDTCYKILTDRDPGFDGRFFIGVHTTGIYCRPICRARIPKQQNVTFYPSAAAAHAAGFRPCLRCHPEGAPEFAARQGAATTVTRALAVIHDGEDSITAVAARLGTDEAHLLRLFEQQLGASPPVVAQTRRVLFAQQLLTETAMPVDEIALAAGFGSVGDLNTTIQTLFGRPLAALRRTHLKHGTRRAADGITLSLAYAPPYDWETLARFLAARAIPGVEGVDNQGHYHRVITLNGAHGQLTVSPQVNHHRLRVDIRFPEAALLQSIVNRVRRLFDLACDPAAVVTHLARDSRLKPLVTARPGLRVPGAWDGFELAVRAILGQQITVGAATKLAGKLVAAYGDRISFDAPCDLTHSFPTPQRLAEVDLRSLGMPPARAVALSALASAAVDNPNLFSPYPTLEATVAAMRALRGIGEWTAQYIAMRAFREPDAFPTGDIGLLRAMADENGTRPSAEELLARAQVWRPWRAYAALYLWSSEFSQSVLRRSPSPAPLRAITNAAPRA